MSSFMGGKSLVTDVSAACLCIPVSFFKKMHLKLSIFNMSILKCVFFYRKSGKFCRSGAERLAGLDRQNLPVWVGNSHLIPVS